MKNFKTSFNTKEEAKEYCSSLPINALLEMCVDLLMERRLPKKISITEEQFRTMFKIVGVREDGTVENRGRKPSVDQNDMAK